MGQIQPDSTSRLLRDLRGFAFDLDGTIWEGPALLPGAPNWSPSFALRD